MAFAWHLSQTLPRRICQKLTHLRKLVFHVSLYSKLALALALALVLLDSEDGLKILAGGEWGLFMRPPAIAWPLYPPPCILASSENFSSPSNPLKLNNHPNFWTAVQFVLSIKRWNRPMEKRWHGFVTVGQFMNTAQSFDNFCQTARQKRRAVNGWNYWGFSFLSNLARHLLPVQISYQNSPKIFFRQILNDFNRLQKFSRRSNFGTGHALTYTEHDGNHPFTDGAAGNR